MNIKPRELTTKQYNAIDLTKFFCAILVVAIHITPIVDVTQKSLLVYCNFGIQHYLARIAVPFFFTASGFLLYKKTTYTQFKLDYSKKYIARLLKLYIIWSIIYFPFAYFTYLSGNNLSLHNLLVYIRSIIFDGSCAHLWYFPSLIFAVCLISFMLFKGVKPKTIVIIAFTFYFVGLFAQSWFGFILPLKEHSPAIWHFLKLTQSIIVTTRDGLFDAFFFVSVGMLFAFYDIDLSARKSFVLFILSMIALFAEVFALQHAGYIREYDMYLFLAPASFFLFSFVIRLELPDRPIYKKLRLSSSLIFLSHICFYWGIPILLNRMGCPLPDAKYHFILVLIISILFSVVVIKLSDYKYFKWLKHLYQ